MTIIEQLGAVDQKQRVRVTLEDGSAIEARVNQSIYDPGETLRLELSPFDDDEFLRYQVRARVEGGTWTAPAVRASRRAERDWVALGTVESVESMETGRTVRSDDADATDETGAGE